MIKFNNFEINTNSRELFKDGAIVKIQNKSLELLLYLIKNRDRAVSKEELLDKLWDGRVVSESVLSHATTKLRAALNDSHGKGDLIRTVYGFGLQFVAQIEESNTPLSHNTQAEIKNQDQPTQSNQTPIKLALIVLLVLTVTILAYFIIPQSFNDKLDTDSSSLIVNQPKINFNNSSINNQEQWLIKGLSMYLNQISAYSGNALLLPNLLTNDNSELANKHYSVDTIIDSKQSNQFISLNLSQSIQADSEFKVALDNLPKAIRLINQWTCKTVFTQNEKCEAKFSQLSVNNAYIIESYLRGIAASLQLDLQKAIRFFEVCLEQDSQFILARLALAQTHLELSNYSKSLSEAETILQLTDNNLIKNQATLIIGKAYLRLSNFDKATNSFNKVMDSPMAQTSQKMMAMMDLAQVYMDSDNLSKAYDLALSSKSLIRDLDLPILEAQAEEIMGTIKMTMGELIIAQQHLESSLKIFEQLEFDSGIEKVLSPLGLVMQSQGLLNASLAYGQQRQKIAEKLGDPISIAGAHLHLANLLLEMGELDKAMNHAESMWKIVINEEEPQALLLAYFIAGEIARADEKYFLALDKYQLAYDIANENKIPFRQVQISCTLGATAIDANELKKANDYLNQCSQFSEQQQDQLFQVVVKLYQSQLFKAQGLENKSLFLLNQALELAKPMGNDHLFYEIYLELYYHAIESDPIQAEAYLNIIPEGYKDDYLFVLYQAQIELKKSQFSSALQLALEAKQLAKDNWSQQDQQLLEQIQSEL